MKTVLTLDAGGTSFVFSAIKDGKEIVNPVSLPAHSDNLDLCLSNLIKGFELVKTKIDSEVDAISFAFPGPADYPNGIIGNLPNFSSFNGGVALGPMLKNKFQIPVFINNDGNLFAYGEAVAGVLPQLNHKLKKSGSNKTYKNLLGITIGTGLGAGIVIDNKMLAGDNSTAAEIHNTLNPFNPDWNAETSISTQAIQREYGIKAGLDNDPDLKPADIYKIAKNEKSGDTNAALYSFHRFGLALGITIANIAAIIDSVVVIGGGISSGWDLFAPSLFEGMNKKFYKYSGQQTDRLPFKVYNLEDKEQEHNFMLGELKKTRVPGTNTVITYDDNARIGIARSRLGASKAISLGAYYFAVEMMEKELQVI